MKPVLRTGFVSLLLAALILVGYWQLMRDEKAQRIAELEQLNEEMEARLAEKEAMLVRLGREHRLAHIDIVDQTLDEAGEPLATTVRLIEVDDRGAEIARQVFTLPGGVLFLDTWTAKFSKDDVAQAHPFRGRTLVLLRRAYSESIAPRDGVVLDTPGAVPAGYAVSEAARFEQQIWRHFWQVATDPDVAARLGVRVAQGEVVYKPVRAGQQFEFSVDADGGINLKPLATGEARAQAKPN